MAMLEIGATLTPVMLEEKLALARAGYVVKLQAKLDHLATLVARSRGGDERALREAQQLAHRLCGTAGTFGLNEVSEATALIDRKLLALRDGRQAANVLWEEISEVLKNVRG